MSDLSPLSELTTKCIRCGFCLEACPTFTETGKETESPRGRIYLVRSALEGHLSWTDEEVGQHLDTCLGCRACETACPSGVQYGQILEGARERLAANRPWRGTRIALKLLTQPKLLRLQLSLAKLLPGKRIPRAFNWLLTHEGPEAQRPRAQLAGTWPELPVAELPPVKGRVYLLEGCAMSVLFPRVHEATRRLLRRVGYEVQEVDARCCGALHAHQGLNHDAAERLAKLAQAMPEALPIIVDSAGCGSHLKEHGDSFQGQVWDVSEFLVREGLLELLGSLSKDADGGRLGKSAGKPAHSQRHSQRVAYHDACHLAHGQRIFSQPRELLKAIPGVELVPLSESDTCCGSAGIYNLAQPTMARRLLERKWRNIEASGADIVALGNPGCHAWIAQAASEKRSPIRVLHTVEVLEEALCGIKGGQARH